MSTQSYAFQRSANFIAGHWVDATTKEALEVRNPATGEVLGEVPNGGAQDARHAIAAARTAFVELRGTTADQRASWLRALYQNIKDGEEELARLLTAEQGKPLQEARAEIALGANYVLWFAEEARRIYGDIIPSPWPERRLLVQKQPVGVVAAITPWNFPFSMIARKVGAAVAAGCTVVVKPASETPLSALAWGVLCEAAGVPAGVVNIITGRAADIGGEMTSSPDVDKISFTGSTAVGKLLLKQAAESVKKVSMELGGNAPFIVFDDAQIDRAVQGAMAAKFRNAGQTCVCANRIYVQTGIYDEFVRKFAAATAALKVGNGQEAGVEQGPLISEGAVSKVEELVADATSKGASVVTGGQRHQIGGSFYEPTVLSSANQNMRIAREEIFGPVAAIFPFETEQSAVEMANDTEYGLACYFYTENTARMFRVMERLNYGLVGVNEALITTEVAPFGGMKASGIGREGSKYGIEDYLEIKYACIGHIFD
ncbi:NAD-dependent succinate-semialdehyde dehydrogenase [Pelagibacterium sp.]|uniref:NAD-dependent succinate-semialdehyde dehydrogenase n=1 Tax=Pelagibacterium sp. TaxID=1967288 RepID=UPI003C7B52ED